MNQHFLANNGRKNMNHVQSPDTSDSAIEREIVAKGLTAPRVTPKDIEANIASEHYNAVNNIWPLMGYELKERLYQAQQQEQAPV